MTDLDTSGIAGTQNVGSQAGSPEQGTSPDVAANGAATATSPDGQPYLLTYNTKEDAENAIKESQRKITELGQENAAIRQKMEQDSKIDSLTDFLARQAASDTQQNSQATHAERLRVLKERIEEDGVGSLVDAMDSSLYDTNQSIEAIKAESARNQAASEAAFEKQIAQMRMEFSPEYQQHKGTIDGLREKFGTLDDNTLLGLAKEMDAKVQNELGSLPPGAGGGHSYTGSTGTPQGISDIDKGIMAQMGLSPESIENADRKERERNKEALSA